jgi:hypothetical protein
MRLLGFLAALIPTLLLTTGVPAQTVYRCLRADGSLYLGQEAPAPGACAEQSTLQWEPPQLPAAPAPADAKGTPSPDRYTLWERREGAGPWSEMTNVESHGVCQAELERRTRSAQARTPNAFIAGPGTVKLRAEGEREYVIYRCLPGGIRPA